MSAGVGSFLAAPCGPGAPFSLALARARFLVALRCGWFGPVVSRLVCGRLGRFGPVGPRPRGLWGKSLLARPRRRARSPLAGGGGRRCRRLALALLGSGRAAEAALRSDVVCALVIFVASQPFTDDD